MRENDFETINNEEKVQKNSMIILQPNSDLSVTIAALLTSASTAKPFTSNNVNHKKTLKR